MKNKRSAKLFFINGITAVAMYFLIKFCIETRSVAWLILGFLLCDGVFYLKDVVICLLDLD
ncbi:TPA: hypothetical protein ACGBG5_003551 [Enterococcus faecalis]